MRQKPGQLTLDRSREAKLAGLRCDISELLIAHFGKRIVTALEQILAAEVGRPGRGQHLPQQNGFESLRGLVQLGTLIAAGRALCTQRGREDADWAGKAGRSSDRIGSETSEWGSVLGK